MAEAQIVIGELGGGVNLNIGDISAGGSDAVINLSSPCKTIIIEETVSNGNLFAWDEIYPTYYFWMNKDNHNAFSLAISDSGSQIVFSADYKTVTIKAHSTKGRSYKVYS